MWITWIAGTMLVEMLVYLIPDLRTAYSLIPGVAFLFFYFSGMILKASTLPGWAAPWLPSVSLIRWQAQALVLNQYDGDTVTFPTVINYSTYGEFLNLFGWGGKTKWYCFYNLLINVAIYRFLMLIAMIKSIITQRGTRSQRKKVEVEDRLY
jgi:hypothetical protein